MIHASVRRFTDILTALQNASLNGPCQSDEALVPGLSLSWDTSVPGTEIALSQPEGSLLQITATVTGAPDWVTLNLDLGESTINAGDVVALVSDATLKGVADGADQVTARLRTRQGDETQDMVLSEPLDWSGTAPGHVAFHTVDPVAVPGAGYHMLLLPLPLHDFTLSLHNLQLCVVGAASGLRSQPMGLASFG